MENNQKKFEPSLIKLFALCDEDDIKSITNAPDDVIVKWACTMYSNMAVEFMENPTASMGELLYVAISKLHSMLRNSKQYVNLENSLQNKLFECYEYVPSEIIDVLTTVFNGTEMSDEIIYGYREFYDSVDNDFRKVHFPGEEHKSRYIVEVVDTLCENAFLKILNNIYRQGADDAIFTQKLTEAITQYASNIVTMGEFINHLQDANDLLCSLFEFESTDKFIEFFASIQIVGIAMACGFNNDKLFWCGVPEDLVSNRQHYTFSSICIFPPKYRDAIIPRINDTLRYLMERDRLK